MRASVSGLFLAALVIHFVSAVAPAAAKSRRGEASSSGLRPGLYSVSILAATLDPRLTVDEQTFRTCYAAADARKHLNPIMPASERAGCNSPDLMVGNVLTFDATCKDGLHNLRLEAIDADTYVGKYLYVGNGRPRLQLEPAVRMHRDGDCP